MNPRTPSRLRAWVGALIVLGTVAVAAAATSPSSPAEALQTKPNKFIGANKCKTCHANKENGDQHGAWLMTKHAKAFEALGSEEAKKFGAAKSISDPQTADACVKCHTTGHGQPKELFDKAFDMKLGVQCETCHGPGEKHMKARLAAASALEEGQPVPKYTPTPAGEVIVSPPEATCKGCHNEESPTFKGFCYAHGVALQRHLLTNKPRTPEELKQLVACASGDACKADASCKPVPDPKYNK